MTTEHITSGIFITWYGTVTRDGKTYYSVSGWRLGQNVYRMSATDWQGDTKDPNTTIGWCDYMSEACYASLPADAREIFDNSDHKVAPYNAMVQIPKPGEPGYFKLGLVSSMVYDVPIVDIACTVINKISPYGDIKEQGWSVDAEEFPACTYSGRHETWHGATQDALINVIPPGTVYMRKSVRDTLLGEVFNSIAHRISGFVDDTYRKSEIRANWEGRSLTCWLFRSESILTVDPCEGVTCKNNCIGLNLHSQKCVNGVCVPDALIEANSAQCGYVPPDPCEGVTCKNNCIGLNLHSQKCVNGVCVPDALIEANSAQCGYVPPKLCTEGEERRPLTCWDGSQIMTEICTKDEFGRTAWLPSGKTCPMRAITRVMDMAIPSIMYEGQAVDIVVQAFCGAAASSNEPTTLQVDGVAVQTKHTLAGKVKFRWTAKGVGMRRVCAVIPINPGCAVPGMTCKTITVSAYVRGIMEQIKAEKSEYESQLEYLRELKKQLKTRPTYGAIPGSIFIPPSLAGRLVEIGGVQRTVPPGGISIPVPPGENIVTIIGDDDERIDVPVDVNPGITVPLPEIPGLPGGF